MVQDCGYDREIPVKVRVIIGVTSLEVKEAPLNPDSGNLNGLILCCSLLRPHRVKKTKRTALASLTFEALRFTSSPNRLKKAHYQ